MIYDKLLSIAAENSVKLESSMYTSAVTPSTPLATTKSVTQPPASKPSSTSSQSTSDSSPSTSPGKKPSYYNAPEFRAASSSFWDSGSLPKIVGTPSVDVASTSIPSASISPTSVLPGQVRQRPQHIRAYRLWHHDNMPLKQMCATLRSPENPLKESTVMYVLLFRINFSLRLLDPMLLELCKQTRVCLIPIVSF